MDRNRLRVIVDAVGSVAIFASLVFVAWELHEVNLASRIAARDSITAGHLDFMGSLIDEDVLPMAVWKLEDDEDALTGFESFQIEIHHQRRWRHYERVYYMYRYGVLAEQEWSGFSTTLRITMTGSSNFDRTSRETLDLIETQLSEEFVNYVRSLAEP